MATPERLKAVPKKLSRVEIDTKSEKLLDSIIRLEAKALGSQAKRTRAQRRAMDRFQADAMKLLASLDLESETDRAVAKRIQASVDELADLRAQWNNTYWRDVKLDAAEIAQERNEALSIELASATDGAFGRRLSTRQLDALFDADVMLPVLRDDLDVGGARIVNRVSRELRLAYVAGESVQKAARRLKAHISSEDTNALTVARTAMQTVSNSAAHSLYDANRDVLTGKQWIATLDSRTCPTCGPLDGRVWLYRGSPSITSMPAAPAHPNCRCFVAPVVKGLSRPEVPTWEDWIQRQPKDVQDDALGLGRAALLRAGRIEARQLSTRTGRIRSVSELTRIANAA